MQVLNPDFWEHFVMHTFQRRILRQKTILCIVRRRNIILKHYLLCVKEINWKLRKVIRFAFL